MSTIMVGFARVGRFPVSGGRCLAGGALLVVMTDTRGARERIALDWSHHKAEQQVPFTVPT
jgi:hypothetical protein